MILLRTLNWCFTKLLYTLINVLAKMLYIMLSLSVITSAVIILYLGKSFPQKNLHSSALHLHACNLLIFNASARKCRCADNFKKNEVQYNTT